jgi:two-component system, cell cycle sensor histidine kinase and response regulator CckA
MTKILIADDISENRYLLMAVFKGSGYEVVSVENGAEALDLALKSPPDLIITDILMPIMDGFELCRRWKAEPRLCSIPFIFYTATYTDPQDERFALSLGAERFVVKPQKPEVLAGLVREVLAEAERKLTTVSNRPLGEEMEVLRQYNEVLFRKLERKVLQLQTEIEERRRVQVAFEESQKRLLEAHRLAHIGIWEWDCDTDKVTWSEELYRIAGIDSQQPAPCYAEHPKLYTLESWTRLEAAVTEALRTSEPYQLELELIRPDGTRRWVNALGGPRHERNGRVSGLHGMLQDVTERKRDEAERQKLEEQLRLSQKMEAIGCLAGGVAHDFNNLLSVILNFADFAIESVHRGDPLRDDLGEIRKAGERAAALTRQLLAFSRKQVLELQVLDLNQVVTNLERMLCRVIGEDIDLGLVLAPDVGWVQADPGQLDQVIMNLVVNARDAMPVGGKLTIETMNVELDEEYVAGHVGVKPGAYVLLAISDNGCGMDMATQQRLFEPFFTTKELGKGTGLGLSTVYGIVNQSGGNIGAYSEPGKGSTFKVYLPRVSADGVQSARSSVSQGPAVGTETVLVVEDEDAVRKVSVRILRGAQYQVLSAAGGGEALLLCEQYQGEIHLLLTDVVMPQMSGRQLAERLRGERPGLRVLYMSGYTNGAIAHQESLESGARLISKPFSAIELTRMVRTVLDSDP